MTFATKIKKMKMYTRLLPIFLLLFGFVSVNAQIKKMGKLQQGVHMTFDQESIALGEVKKGEKRTFDFFFTNTGTDVIDIEIVSGCDCTTLDWPRKSIKPGERGKINVIFDSKDKDNSDPVDVDIYLKNIDPKTKNSILKVVNYTFKLIK